MLQISVYPFVLFFYYDCSDKKYTKNIKYYYSLFVFVMAVQVVVSK